MMKYVSSVTVVFVVALSFNSINCSGEGNGPNDNVQPGRRDYTWYVDTVSTPETMLRSIDGIASDDVWAVSAAGDFRYTVFHFNGTNWSTDGVNRPLSPSAVKVFNSNNAWIVGSQGDIWHFDGSSWIVQAKLSADSSSYWSIEDIDGVSSDFLYATGVRQYQDNDLHPLMYRYSGNSWSRMDIPEVTCSLYKIRSFSSGNALILGLKNATSTLMSDTNKIFQFDGVGLKELYSSPRRVGYLPDIARVQGGLLMLKGRELFFYDGSKSRFILTLDQMNFGGVIEGRSANDIFLGMSDGIAHYNGTDIQYLFQFPGSSLHGYYVIKFFPKSVFVVVYDYDKKTNFIYRGYLS